MHDELGRRQLDSLKKEAKRWLRALRAGAGDAHARLVRALGSAPDSPTLRDVQLALAREHGFAGWTALKTALESDAATSKHALARYEKKAEALLDAYGTGTPDALERHYALTWHRRAWPTMRSYIQLDLGKRADAERDDVEIDLDDARYLIAIEHGFTSWDELRAFVTAAPSGVRMSASPVSVLASDADDARELVATRDWTVALRALADRADVALDAHGQMTDEMLEQVSRVGRISALRLGGSKALTDEGVRHLARVPALRELDLSQSAVTDAGLAVLRQLPALESLSLAMTTITDAGLEHVRQCEKLRRLNLMWTATGDGAIRALGGKAKLTHLWSGNDVTDAGLAALHDLPVFDTWHGGEAHMTLLGRDESPNLLSLRGSFTDAGMSKLRGLDGIFGLEIAGDAHRLGARALEPLAALPHLTRLSIDAGDDWMPYIAELPALRFLSVQDTSAGDDGFAALSRSRSIEYIWGRRCHNLRARGFVALGAMPKLRGLSVSCLNVDDAAIATLPEFPALRELMPMDVPDAGYRHIGRCAALEALLLMYCRDTTDVATEHIAALPRLQRYFNSYTIITDRTPALLSTMDSLERITFDACHNLTNDGIARLARLPRLREVRASGRRLTSDLASAFPARVTVHYSP